MKYIIEEHTITLLSVHIIRKKRKLTKQKQKLGLTIPYNKVYDCGGHWNRISQDHVFMFCWWSGLTGIYSVWIQVSLNILIFSYGIPQLHQLFKNWIQNNNEIYINKTFKYVTSRKETMGKNYKTKWPVQKIICMIFAYKNDHEIK